jgi:PAS domain S-box-containing protein
MHYTACPIVIDGKRYFTGIGLDTSERDKTLQALQESERNLQSVFDAISESVCFIERDGTVLAANTTFAARLGKTVEDCVGKDAFSMLPRELAARRKEYVDRVFEGGEPVSFDDVRNGRSIRQTLYPVKDASGRTTRLVIYASDVTEQARLVEALRISEVLYRTLFDALPFGITVSDAAGAILQSNEPAERILGLSSEEHESRRIDGSEWRIVRLDGSPMPPEEFASTRALIEGRSVENVIMGLPKGEAGRVWVSVSASPIPLEGYGVAIAYVDVSERVEAEARVKALLREKDIILSETHHRVKNNMGMISSLLQLQAEEGAACAEGSALSEAASRVRSMMVLYDRLYRSGGRADLSVKEFLPGLVGQIAEALGAGTRIRTLVEADDFILSARTLSPLGVIVNELVTNSFKHAFKGGASGLLRVSATRRDGLVTLVYEDDGPGLPEAAGAGPEGGFGLRLVGMLTEQIGGSLRIERGGGARFVIEFESP